jgi:outer membrane cobalamin receptor
MQLSASYAYAPGRDEITNQELTNSAHNLTKLNLAMPIAHNSMSLSADAQYTGARKTLAGNSVGAFPMFNVTLLSHQLSHVDVSASVYNLLNRSHWDPALPDYPMDRIQQDGRSLRVKLTWHSQIDSH